MLLTVNADSEKAKLFRIWCADVGDRGRTVSAHQMLPADNINRLPAPVG